MRATMLMLYIKLIIFITQHKALGSHLFFMATLMATHNDFKWHHSFYLSTEELDRQLSFFQPSLPLVTNTCAILLRFSDTNIQTPSSPSSSLFHHHPEILKTLRVQECNTSFQIHIRGNSVNEHTFAYNIKMLYKNSRHSFEMPVILLQGNHALLFDRQEQKVTSQLKSIYFLTLYLITSNPEIHWKYLLH